MAVRFALSAAGTAGRNLASGLGSHAGRRRGSSPQPEAIIGDAQAAAHLLDARQVELQNRFLLDANCRARHSMRHPGMSVAISADPGTESQETREAYRALLGVNSPER